MGIISISKDINNLLSRIESGGFSAYIVGGCVRDMLMGKIPSDYDVCTSARPDDIKKIFHDCPVIPTGIKHGTVTVVWKGVPYEITTYRSDMDYADHRHPTTVAFSDAVEDDLCRRDFTVNAMCYNPQRGLIDLFGGVGDMEKKLLRCVGDAKKRFTEDSLRILRCLRFSSRLGFEIEPKTEKAMYSCLPYTKALSVERIYSELKGILTAAQKCGTVKRYYDILLYVCGLSKSALPKETIIKALEFTDDEYGFAVFAALVADDKDNLLAHLKADGKTKLFCKGISKAKQGFDTALSVAECARKYGIEATRLAMALCSVLGTKCSSDCENTLNYITNGKLPLTIKDLALGGDALVEMGFRGADIGAVQDALYAAVYDGTENEKNALMNTARNIAKKKGVKL